MMAPKVEPTLPSTRHFVRGTYVPDFSTFGFWATLQFMLEILFSERQTEQLFRPGETFPTNMELARSILFPGMAPANPSYTPPELLVLAQSRAQWVYNVPHGATLPGSPSAWAPFMFWVTLPLSTFQRCMVTAQRTGTFVLNFADVVGTLDGSLNLSFSPRSALLFYTFQLSISERQGRTFEFSADEMVATFGFRVTQQWLAIYFGTGRARMWNRRYCDFLVKTSSLQVPLEPSWATFCMVYHFAHPYTLVLDLNQYLDGNFRGIPCRHFRLMHLPLLERVYNEAYHMEEGWVPLSGVTPTTLTRPARL